MSGSRCRDGALVHADLRALVGGNGGMVLITVIWLLALLGGLVMAMSLYATSVLAAIDAANDGPRADAALAAGLNRAAAAILTSDAEAPAVQPGAENGPADDPGLIPASVSGSAVVGGARVSWSAVNETARIDVNLAPPDLLAGLFAELNVPAEEAAAYAARIVGLRASGTRPQVVANKPPGYDPFEETPAAIQALARGGQPKPGEADPNKPFVDEAQLQQVTGLPAALMARAAPYLTAFSGNAAIDVRTAAPAIIAALPGLTRERLRSVMAARTADAASLADALGEARTFTTDKRSPATRIAITVTLADGVTRNAEIVIVHFGDDLEPFRVVAWNNDAQPRRTTAKDALP